MALAAPAELGALRERLAELSDLRGAATVLSWDQNTYMPPGGAEARAQQLATLEKLAHARQVAPELDRLLAALEPWAASEDPDADDVGLVRVARRDHEKAVRVPERIAVAMAGEAARGYGAWMQAREQADFALLRDPLARQVELRREYAACFDDAEHPYDVLLDDHEPGMTLARLRPLFHRLVAALQPLVQRATAAGVQDVLGRAPMPIAAQRALLAEVLPVAGFDARTWRLDDTTHPFAQSPGAGDVRITTRWSEANLGASFYSGLHEFGHGLYEAGFGAGLRRTPLADCASLGVHESQSRLWENVIGRGRPFCEWVLPRLQRHLPEAFGDLDAAGLYRGLNGARRSLIRTEADETTYNLHVALRLDLEVELLEGALEVRDLPDAWDAAFERRLGLAVPSVREGVLQDVHWAVGLVGYFPTYTLGNLLAAQLWGQLRADLPDVDAAIAAGDFAGVRAWLAEHVHRHGRKFAPGELLRRATRQELDERPFVAYLQAKLEDAAVL